MWNGEGWEMSAASETRSCPRTRLLLGFYALGFCALSNTITYCITLCNAILGSTLVGGKDGVSRQWQHKVSSLCLRDQR